MKLTGNEYKMATPKNPANNNCDENSSISTHLEIKKYQNWYDDLVRGNAQKALYKLESVGDNERFAMINSPFDYQDTHIRVTKYTKQNKRLYLPFHIALTSCAEDVVRLLLEHGVDVLCVDFNRYNVLHACPATTLRSGCIPGRNRRFEQPECLEPPL